MTKLREVFSVYKDENGQFYREDDKTKKLTEVKLAVSKPNHKQQSEADFEYAKYINKYIHQGIGTSASLERTIRENGIWDDEKAEKELRLGREMREIEEKLKRGKMKVSQGVELAKKGLRARGEWMVLVMEKNNILNNSADSLAGNHRFNYLTSLCTTYDHNGKPVFENYEDFLNKDSQGNLLPTMAGQVFSRLMYNMDEDFRKDWYEYKFLAKYKAVNDKLEFIDKDGRVVDIDGNPIEQIVPTENKEEEEAEFYPDDTEETD